MEKKWSTYLPLLLCAVLLVMVLRQSAQLREYREQIDSQIQFLHHELNSQYNSINQLYDNVEEYVEEAQRVIKAYDLQPSGVDTVNRTLNAEFTIELKEWHTDTRVMLLASVNGKQSNLPMTNIGAGIFSVSLPLPLDSVNNFLVQLSATVTGGGLTRQEELGSWSELSMLLPLSLRGGGWSEPTYLNGMMQSDFHVRIDGQGHQTAPVCEPMFHIYKNGELAQTLNAVIDPNSSSSIGINFTTDTENYVWCLPCAIGDVIEIRFLCQDEYGLGYDFLFQTWTAAVAPENQTGAGIAAEAQDLTLFWPE